MEIARIVKEKQEEERDLIKIRIVEEMVLRRFHKYLKVFEKNIQRECQQESYGVILQISKSNLCQRREKFNC